MRITSGQIEERFDAAARRTACHVVKARARFYVRRPGALDTLHPGLSMADADTLIAVAAHLLEREMRCPHRWFGFGGDVGVVNARAALLLGRGLRRSTDRRKRTHMQGLGEQNP